MTKIEQLTKMLNEMPCAYYDFIVGTLNYAKKKPSRLEAVLDFINRGEAASPSDIVKFISEQDDFFEDAV